jgi:curved DNA-binding protein
MTAHYQTLGIEKNATASDIKQAYRRLANQHHPDKGGDQAKFKDIASAYETLGNPDKRAAYDNGHTGGFGQHTHTTHHNFHDIFGQQFAGAHFSHIFGQHHQQAQRNRDLNMNCQVSFIDSVNGKQLEAKYNLPSGKNQSIVIDIPAGVEHGATIQYQGLGDDSIPGVARGNLNVTIGVSASDIYRRMGNDIYIDLEISPIDAMIGCRKSVLLVTGVEVMMEITAGAETGTEFIRPGGGFTNLHSGHRGNFVAVTKIKTPAIRNIDLINRLIQLNNEINNIT